MNNTNLNDRQIEAEWKKDEAANIPRGEFLTHLKISLDSLPTLAQQNKEKKSGISIISTDEEKQGSDVAKELLYEITDNKTVLFLSGGKTPANLYSELGEEQKLKIGAAAMVDERYGKPEHANSNELMIGRSVPL